MNLARKLEMIGGMVTGLLGIAVTWDVFSFYYRPGTLSEQKIFLDALFATVLFQLLPGLLVATGAYAHVARRKGWGFIMLVASGLIAILLSLSFFLVPVFQTRSLWHTLTGALGVMALVTLVTALLRELRQYLSHRPEEK